MVHLLASAVELTNTCDPFVDINCDASSHVQPTQVDQLIVLSFSTFESDDEVVDTRIPSMLLAVDDGSLSF